MGTGRKKMPEEDERIMDEQKRKKEMEERFQDTHNKIIETFKDRKKFEKEYLDIIEKQKKYWNDRLKETDPQKNKERYDELKDKIKNEETLIKQIKDEVDRIDDALRLEKEHEEQEHKEKTH